MSSRIRQQHIAPSFYLSQFADPDGNVWTYSDNSAPRADKPEATAIETKFFSPIGEDGERIDEVAEFLGQIERQAAPFWEDLCKGKIFAGEERGHIALFLAAQYIRSPSMVRAGAELNDSMAQDTSQFIAADKKSDNGSVDNHEEDSVKSLSPEERERMPELNSEPENYSINVLRSMGLPVLMVMDGLTKLFSNMTWTVGHSEDQHLITSDSPVTRTSDSFFDKAIQVQFPLTPQRIIELTWRGEEQERVVALSKHLARAANQARADQAERFVYGSKKDRGIEKLCAKWL